MKSNYRERLRQLSLSRPESDVDTIEIANGARGLDHRTLALARLAALVAVGGAGPSFGEHVDAAIRAGATADEMVDVLIAITSVVGVPRVVDAAPKLALSLGYDLDDAVD